MKHYYTWLGSLNFIVQIHDSNEENNCGHFTNAYKQLWGLGPQVAACPPFLLGQGHHCVTHKMASEPEFVDSKNVSWLNNKGSWLAYILLVLGLHFFLMTVPLISVPTVWTLTNVLHSVVSSWHVVSITDCRPWWIVRRSPDPLTCLHLSMTSLGGQMEAGKGVCALRQTTAGQELSMQWATDRVCCACAHQEV